MASTVEGYPTFWFYLPPYQTSMQSVEFVLLDQDRHLFKAPIYAQLPQNSEGVIAGLTLPNQGKTLEVGKQYSWYFSILCDPFKPSRNPELTGQIQRVLPSTLPVSNKPSYLVYDNTYTGQEGIESVVFYDTVTQLIEKRSSYPSDWSTLLSNAEIPNSAKPVKLDLLDRPPEQCASSILDKGITMSNDPPKLVAINKQPNHNIVQPHGLGKVDGLMEKLTHAWAYSADLIDR